MKSHVEAVFLPWKGGHSALASVCLPSTLHPCVEHHLKQYTSCLMQDGVFVCYLSFHLFFLIYNFLLLIFKFLFIFHNCVILWN